MFCHLVVWCSCLHICSCVVWIRCLVKPSQSAAIVTLRNQICQTRYWLWLIVRDLFVGFFAAPLWGRETLADVQGRQLQEGPEEVRPPHRRPQEAAGESLRRRGEGTTAVLWIPTGFSAKPERFSTAAPVFVYSRGYIRESLGNSYTAAAYCAADRLPPSELLHEWILVPWNNHSFVFLGVLKRLVDDSLCFKWLYASLTVQTFSICFCCGFPTWLAPLN